MEAGRLRSRATHARIDRAVSHLASPGRLASPRTRGLFLMQSHSVQLCDSLEVVITFM